MEDKLFERTYIESVSFSFELSGGVDLVSHDARDGLLHVLHPLGHLVVPHVVHLLDELVVLLPESHLDVLGSLVIHEIQSIIW